MERKRERATTYQRSYLYLIRISQMRIQIIRGVKYDREHLTFIREQHRGLHSRDDTYFQWIKYSKIYTVGTECIKKMSSSTAKSHFINYIDTNSRFYTIYILLEHRCFLLLSNNFVYNIKTRRAQTDCRNVIFPYGIIVRIAWLIKRFNFKPFQRHHINVQMYLKRVRWGYLSNTIHMQYPYRCVHHCFMLLSSSSELVN